jgi:hypothetical protein
VNARAFDVRFQEMNGLRLIGKCLIINAPLRKRFAFVAGNDGYATFDLGSRTRQRLASTKKRGQSKQLIEAAYQNKTAL